MSQENVGVVLVGSGAVLPTPDGVDAWEVFSRGIDAARELPESRLRLNGQALDRWRELGLEMPRSWRGYTAEPGEWRVDLAARCGVEVDPSLVEMLDRSSRYALSAALQAWDSAVMEPVDRTRVACLLGSIALPTEATAALFERVAIHPLLHDLGLGELDQRPGVGTRPGGWHSANHWAMSLPPLVVRQVFGLAGEVAALDAACASSLYAVSRGCDLLRSGGADAVLVGGTSGADRLYTQLGFSALQALSRSGRCSPFDQRADGLVVGEGAAVFVLKREEDALRHGDRILGKILGCGLSNDREGGLLAPSAEGQLRALRAAYREAEIAPQDVDLIECHATGTPLGDAIEIGSLNRLLSDRPPTRPIALGATKANVGHLLTGAGAAGLYKVLLSFDNEVLPPVANFDQARDKLGIEHGPLRILRQSEEWPEPTRRPRRAAVSAFGFGGINAHIVLEEWRPTPGQSQVLVVADESPSSSAPVVEPITADEVFALPSAGSSDRTRVRETIHVTGMAALCGSADDRQLREWMLWGRRPTDWVPELEQVQIDLQRFRIPPRELVAAMTQQLVALELARAALIDSGALQSGAQREAHWLRDGDTTGVFAACDLDPSANDFAGRWAAGASVLSAGSGTEGAHLPEWIDELCPPLDADRTLGSLGGIVASRVAREFGCGGQSYVLADAGLSGQRALSAACEALATGRLKRAIVVGVDLACDARQQILRGLTTAYGPQQRCQPMERESRNAFAADQAVALVLESAAAISRNQTRYGTVDANAFEALHESSWFESSASGAPRRDAPVARFFRQTIDSGLGVGTVSGTIGLAEGVAGLLAIYRSLLGLRAGLRPHSLEHDEEGGSRVVRRADRASVAVEFSCPLAGRADVKLQEEALELASAGSDASALGTGLTTTPFFVGAESAEELTDRVRSLQAMVKETPHDSVRELAAAWNHLEGRLDSRERLAFSVTDRDGLERTLELLTALGPGLGNASQNELPAGVHRGRLTGKDAPRIAFVYPGSGQLSTWRGVPVLDALPGVVKRLRSLHPELESLLVRGAERESQVSGTTVADQILRQVTTSLALHEVLAYCGVKPDAVLGYSLGETAALMACRVWRDQATLIRRMHESPLFREALAGPFRAPREALKWPDDHAFDWSVAVVTAGPEEVRGLLADSSAQWSTLRLLVVNTDEECLVGGERGQLRQFAEEHSLSLLEIPHVAAVHCDLASPCSSEYRAFHSLECSPGRVDVYGTAAGVRYSPTGETCADSLTRQAIEGFDFRRLVRNAWKDGVRVFVEVGPGASCTRMIRTILADEFRDDGQGLATALSDESGCQERHLLGLVCQLWTRGVEVDLAALLPPGGKEDPPEHSRTVSTRRHVDRERIRRTLAQRPHIVGGQGGEPQDSPASDSPASSADEGFQDLPSAQESTPAAQPPRSLDREQCLEFARGKVGPVFGPSFAPVDEFPTRVRLPDEPLMLVDRVLEIEGEPRSMSTGRVVTEHDVLEDGWYLDQGVLPTAIAVESGQADLMLSGYLGIDFETEGLQRYRLLDAVVTFHQELPEAGEVVRYDISIDRFFHQGDNWLFRFGFDATVSGRPLLTMRDGCAGFFSEGDLEAGRGLIRSRLELAPQDGVSHVEPLLEWNNQILDRSAVDAVLRGDLATAFGTQFDDNGCDRPATLPGGRLDLVDRVVRMERRGGRFGLGLVEAEADVPTDAWYLTCHFVDDQVMPGTLMYECCLHALRIFLLRSGWVGEKGKVRWQPVPGVASRLRCRGQVTAETRVAGYRVEIKEIGARPEPYVVADAILLADGREIVAINDLSLRLSGVTYDELRELWSAVGDPAGASGRATPANPRALDEANEPAAVRDGAPPHQRDEALRPAPAVYDRSTIEEFASGRPSRAFGEPYLPFDGARRIARLPRDPYQFLDAIVAVEGEPFVLQAGARCTAQWTVSEKDWYFEANRQPTVPFAVLLEAALQPCGWLAAYCGSALTSDSDLSFRNLGGEATLHAMPGRADDLVSTMVELTRTSSSGGMIIQHFSMEVESVVLGRLYSGTTYFGFFPPEALANQVGLRELSLWELAEGAHDPYRLPDGAPFPDDKWRMVDQIVACTSNGGLHGRGFVRGVIDVNPEAWFFQAHFYQDPVWPGSLGLEAVLQLLRLWVTEHVGPGLCFQAAEGPQRFDPAIVEHRHRWTYRGQIVPADERVTVEASVRELVVDPASGEGRVTADGLVSVDGRVIYQLRDFGLSFGR